MSSLYFQVVLGLLKFWPKTCSQKEVCTALMAPTVLTCVVKMSTNVAEKFGTFDKYDINVFSHTNCTSIENERNLHFRCTCNHHLGLTHRLSTILDLFKV